MTLDQQSQIRLDWDDITWSECRERLSQIKEVHLVKQIELRFSPKSGFHIIVSSYFNLPITRVWHLRRLWHDDGNRLVMDILHYPAYYRDVLFQRKGDWAEEPLITYTRLHYNSDIWKKEINPKMNQESNLLEGQLEKLLKPRRRDYDVKP